jgi:hypothetical protein
LAADKLPIAFELEADRMRNLSINPPDFTKEIQVVMEERRMRTDDNPQALAYERFLAAANIATGYHHMVIGWMNDLQHMTAEDLRKWYKQWYGPNNAVLVVVGDVNPEQVYQLALKYFGPLQPVPLPEAKPQVEIPSMGMRSLVAKLPAQLPWIIIGYNVPSLKTYALPLEKGRFKCPKQYTLRFSCHSRCFRSRKKQSAQCQFSAWSAGGCGSQCELRSIPAAGWFIHFGCYPVSRPHHCAIENRFITTSSAVTKNLSESRRISPS